MHEHVEQNLKLGITTTIDSKRLLTMFIMVTILSIWKVFNRGIQSSLVIMVVWLYFSLIFHL